MFTGIVEEVGTVLALEQRAGTARLEVACATVTGDARVGDSISVNGCCLTVTVLRDGGGFAAELMGETLRRTALGALSSGSPVNLERALRADGRLGGHIVQGHVDAVGEVLAVQPQQEWTVMAVTLPPDLRPYVVEKGSIAVDGASLTVMDVDRDAFRVGLIPHTLEATVLGRRRVGDRVNLEADVIGKYVHHYMASQPSRATGAPDPQET